MAQPPSRETDASGGESPEEYYHPLEEVRRHGIGAAAFFLGFAALLTLPIYLLHRKKKAAPPSSTQETVVGEGVLLGRWGYALYVPAGYTARAVYDPSKIRETVSFIRTGTAVENPHLWAHYKSLGIITLVVSPSPVPDTLSGLRRLEKIIMARNRFRREACAMHEVSLSRLKAVSFDYGSPRKRFEVYALGERLLYVFTTGAPSHVMTQILTSLRDTKRED